MKAKLSAHAERLNLFLTHLNTGALGRIEVTQGEHTKAFKDIKTKLESIHADVRAGRKDSVLLSCMEDWGTLEKELVDDNITEVDVELNKEEIAEWLKHLQEEEKGAPVNSVPEKGLYQATVEDAEEGEEKSHSYPTVGQSSGQNNQSNAPSASLSGRSTPDTVIHETTSSTKAGVSGGATPNADYQQRTKISASCTLEEQNREASRYIGRIDRFSTTQESKPAEYYPRRSVETIPPRLSARPKGTPRTSRLNGMYPKIVSRESVDQVSSHTGADTPERSHGAYPEIINWGDDDFERTGLEALQHTRSSTGKDRLPYADHEIIIQEFFIDEAKDAKSSYCDPVVLDRPLILTLEDLFWGKLIRIYLTRKVSDPGTGRTRMEKEVLEVPIQKDLKAGSTVRCSAMTSNPAIQKREVQFVIEHKTHPFFRQEGDDLRCTVKISLCDLLCGCWWLVRTIDGGTLSFSHSGPLHPSYQNGYTGHGMPNSKEPSKRGDLIVDLDVQYPTRIAYHHMGTLHQILCGDPLFDANKARDKEDRRERSRKYTNMADDSFSDDLFPNDSFSNNSFSDDPRRDQLPTRATRYDAEKARDREEWRGRSDTYVYTEGEPARLLPTRDVAERLWPWYTNRRSKRETGGRQEGDRRETGGRQGFEPPQGHTERKEDRWRGEAEAQGRRIEWQVVVGNKPWNRKPHKRDGGREV